tara:strand:+ start:567 stop:1136 length:570 start_codon:yes stop_codon:yes gene_type:complete
MGNICRNCVSEVIKIKKDDNEKTICMYECPFCKNVNDNTLPHISGLNKEEFNNLIDKKVTEVNNEYRENTENIIEEQKEIIDNFHTKSQGLTYELYNIEHRYSRLENLYKEQMIISDKLEDSRCRLANERWDLLFKITDLEKQLKIQNRTKDRYYCKCCDKEMNKSSKYAHFKSKSHIKANIQMCELTP